ncbi:MAG TPA: primosomal protein N' [Bryobacteraceae bacterium]|nr:primosomal protein N' [Bryobacteraceae bacterium]
MKYCDVSLPIPLDQLFTYSLPETLQHRTRAGSRVFVPFGPRKMTGVVLAVHDDQPEGPLKQVLRLIDEDPVLDRGMIDLARWIAAYYCAPLGEVLRTMTPLTGELRSSKMYTLTDAGVDAARQLLIAGEEQDAAVQVMQLLQTRPLSASYLKQKIPTAVNALRTLTRKGFVEVEDIQADRDPLRASAERLIIEGGTGLQPVQKLPKWERELLAYLELHPGSHNLAEVETVVKNASQSARALARKNLVQLRTETHLANPDLRPVRTLNPDQLTAYQNIEGALRTHQFHSFLLHGVTGSGKTEVYLKSIDACLAFGRGALLLVPEIALTPAVAGQFLTRFGDQVAILHSAFNDVERAEQWRRIQAGKARVVVGTRSGVFAPVQDLGLIVIDEEHDGSYKQQETPRYNGRDVAIVRAQAANACVVLGSATPSLETRYNADRSKYTLLELPERIEQRPLPDVELIDMRQEFLETRKQSTFSRRLLEGIAGRLESGEQTMLLLNRRGFSSFVACRACGERIECLNCSVTLTYHRRDRRLLCHYCDYAQRVPSRCPKCDSEYLQFIGVGSEKVEDELHQNFPEARIARMDRDTVTGKRQFEKILFGFREGNYDILVGTQMIAKGHDIPNVTLVGVVSADVGLGMPDFRAAERTFQLLTQAAGRAGRGNLPGIVLIQTINPDHYAIRFASGQNYKGFYEKEIQFRKAMRYPPFSALANVLIRSENQEQALKMSAEVAHLLDPAPEGIRAIGPAEAPVAKLKREFRYQILIKAVSRKTLNDLLRRLRQFANEKKWGATALVIDVDPLTLM